MDPKLYQFVRRAMTVPFKPRGRAYTGWDCWGMFRMAYLEVKGIELPLYDFAYSTKPNEELTQSISYHRALAECWREVPADQLEPMDGLVLRRKGQPIHVALAIGRERYLHTEFGIDTVVQRIGERGDWPQCLEGAYRYAH